VSVGYYIYELTDLIDGPFLLFLFTGALGKCVVPVGSFYFTQKSAKKQV